MNIDKSKTIKYDDLPKSIQEFLSENHAHYPNDNGDLIYFEKDILILIANLLDK